MHTCLSSKYLIQISRHSLGHNRVARKARSRAVTALSICLVVDDASKCSSVLYGGRQS